MRPEIEAITHRLLDRFTGGDRMELIHDFAYRLPTLVMCHMLGIDEEEADDALLDQLNQAIADSFLVLEMRPLTDDELALANRQIDFLETFFQTIFARRRLQPRNDLATALLNAREGDSQLSEREMVTVAIARDANRYSATPVAPRLHVSGPGATGYQLVGTASILAVTAPSNRSPTSSMSSTVPGNCSAMEVTRKPWCPQGLMRWNGSRSRSTLSARPW